MPIVHHTVPTFTGSEVVAGIALDFTNGSAVVDELNSAAEAVVTAVKGWTVTGDTERPAPEPEPELEPVPADTDIHADTEDGPLLYEPDLHAAPEDEA